MPKQPYTEEERNEILSPEERAGLAELDAEDYGPTLEEQLEAEEAGRPLPEPEPAPTVPTPPAPGDAPPAPKADAQPPAPPPTPAPTPGDPPPSPAPAAEPAPLPAPPPKAERTGPLPDWQAPADVDDQIKALNAKRLELAQQHDDGDITTKDMREQDIALANQVADLEWQKRRADMAQESRQAHSINDWKTNVATFLAQEEHAAYREGPHYDALNAEVARQQVAAREAGRDMHDPAILEAAFAAVHARMSPTTPTPTPPTPSVPEPPTPQPPPTLRNMPASDLTPTRHGSEFASLDGLKGEALEEAVSRLTEEQRDRYLMGG